MDLIKSNLINEYFKNCLRFKDLLIKIRINNHPKINNFSLMQF